MPRGSARPARYRTHGATSPRRRAPAGTLRTCMRYRVTGLAAEAGFFTLLSLPAFVLGLVASRGLRGAVPRHRRPR